MSEIADLANRAVALSRTISDIAPDRLEIATTPKTEMWSAGKARLFRYDTEKRKLGPLVLMHGLVGRQSMTDLEPKRSLVRKLLAAGVDLWVIDWGNPDRTDRLLDTAHFADRLLGQALNAVEAESGGKPALFGICQGGTFATIHAALHPDRLSGLAVAVAPIDFHADESEEEETRRHGFLNHWLRSLPPRLIEDMLEEFGNLPGALAGVVFQNLTPARTVAKYTTGLLALSDDREGLETFLRMERWLADRPDHPGAAAKEWLIGLYHENRLVESRFEIGGRRVRLGDIACPVLNVYGTEDHIVPPACTRALGDHLGEDHDYQEVAIPTGHVGVFVSRKALGILPGAVTGWLARIG